MLEIDGKKIAMIKGCDGGDVMLIDPREFQKALYQLYDYNSATLILYGMCQQARRLHSIDNKE